MVHAVIERIRPGDVLILTMPEPGAVALIGELLATQVKVRGAAAILVDGAIRDFEELSGWDYPSGLVLFECGVRPRHASVNSTFR